MITPFQTQKHVAIVALMEARTSLVQVQCCPGIWPEDGGLRAKQRKVDDLIARVDELYSELNPNVQVNA